MRKHRQEKWWRLQKNQEPLMKKMMKAVSGMCCRRRHCRPRRCCPCCRRRPRRHRYFRSSCPCRHCLSHFRFRCTCRCRRRHRRSHRRLRYRCRCKDRSLGNGVTPINIWQIIHIKKNHIHMISLHVSERSALRLCSYVCDFSLCVCHMLFIGDSVYKVPYLCSCGRPHRHPLRHRCLRRRCPYRHHHSSRRSPRRFVLVAILVEVDTCRLRPSSFLSL